jgi:regulator of sigma E protease
MTALSWVLAVAGFMALVIVHEAGHFAAAKSVGMRVERFALFFPPLLLRKKIGETEYALGAIPLGGYVRISGMNPSEDLPEDVRDRAYHAQAVWKRIVVIAAGPAVNLVVGFVLLVGYFSLIGTYGETTTQVDQVDPQLPAAGKIAPGDRIIGIDGHLATPEYISASIAGHPCKDDVTTNGCLAQTPVRLLVQKPDGTRSTVELRPVYDGAASVKRPRVGFTYLAPRKTLSLGQSVAAAANGVVHIALNAIQLPLYVIDPDKRQEISGVVGITVTVQQTFLSDPADTLFLLAIISLLLAVINLFPFLPLDGGHIFWAIVEKLRRRPVPLATMERAGLIGILLLIPLFYIGLTNDIGQLMNGGFAPVR